MKKLSYLMLALFALTSCSSLKKVSNSAPAPAANVNENKKPLFIENISINPGKQVISSTEQGEIYQASYAKSEQGNSEDNLTIEANELQIKYAILLNLPIETSLNHRMLEFIEEWYGTPYRYGGTSKKGIDCSAFVNFFMSAVYDMAIPRNSKEQYSAAKKIKKKELEEGDLVFFNTRGGISHVGVYLGNNKFAHASVSGGVMISDLDDEYFSRRYVGSGRVR